MDEVRTRDRQPTDVPRCVAVLAEAHRADHYPLTWPADPAGWLTPATTGHAWVAEIGAAVAGHVVVAPPARAVGICAKRLRVRTRGSTPDAVVAWGAVRR
jgi:hypothetical protein